MVELDFDASSVMLGTIFGYVLSQLSWTYHSWYDRQKRR